MGFQNSMLQFTAGAEMQYEIFLLFPSCNSPSSLLHLYKPSNSIFLSLMPVKGAGHRNQSSKKQKLNRLLMASLNQLYKR